MRCTIIFFKSIVFAAVILLCNVINAQDVVIQESADQVTKEEVPSEVKMAHARWDYTSIGFGTGLDYGGHFGVNFTQYLGQTIGAFGGVGYNLDQMAYNVGAKLRLQNLFNCKKSAPFLVAMYGYNAVALILKEDGGIWKSKTFYGATFGIGFDARNSVSSTSYWTLAILYPVRDPAFMDFYKKHDTTPFSLPFTISIGYRITLF